MSQDPRKRQVVCGLSSRAVYLFVHALIEPGPVSDRNELVGLLDIDHHRVRTYLDSKGLTLPVYAPDQLDRMLDDLEPDGAIVATPDGLHVDYVVGALQRGIDVIVEKPMVVSADQARRIFEAEAGSSASVQVTHNSRYEPGNMLIKRLLLDGHIGRITNIDLNWQIDTYHGSSYFYRWNRDRAKSGGMSITKGCHHFDLLNWWVNDRPDTVFAFGALNYYGAGSPHNPSNVDGVDYSVREQKQRCPYRRRWSSGADDDHVGQDSLPNEVQYPASKEMYIYDKEIAIEDTYSAVIRYRSGASVSYSANFSTPFEGYTLAINGTHGRLERTDLYDRRTGQATDQVVTCYPMFGDRQDYTIDEKVGSHGGADPVLLQNLFVAPIPEDTALGLRAGSVDGAMAVAIGEAIWRSATEERPIRIGELFPAR